MLVGVTVAVDPPDIVPVVAIAETGLLHVYTFVPVEGAVGELPSVRVNTVEPKHNAGVEDVIAASTGWASTITFTVTGVLAQPVSPYVADNVYAPLNPVLVGITSA